MNTKTNKKEEMTLDRFAEIVMAEFIDLRQDMNSGFTRLENRLDNVESKVQKLDYRVDKFEQGVNIRFDELTYRIDGLAVDKVSYDEYNKLDSRTRFLEKKLAI